MTNNFNTYIESPAVDYLRELCLREGELRQYDRGDAFSPPELWLDISDI